MESTYIAAGTILAIAFAVWLYKSWEHHILYPHGRSRYQYPYMEIKINISGKRQPDIEDCIDEYLIENRYRAISKQEKEIAEWKAHCEYDMKHYHGGVKKRLEEMYKKRIDDKHAFRFILVRYQTRYRQQDYVRTSYRVEAVVEKKSVSSQYLEKRYQRLKEINFECTLSDYFVKDQRKMMTKELRGKVAKRDNYTCQICGKRMQDGVGLQIDHIIPVAKGGKSIMSNLQVLCSKCNGRKGGN